MNANGDLGQIAALMVRKAMSHRTKPLGRRAKTGSAATLALGFVTALMMLTATSAQALKPAPDEKERLEACERRLCETVIRKTGPQGTIDCSLTKTWQRSKIKDGAKGKKLSWGFGDATCRLDVKIPRSSVHAAMTSKKYKLFFAPQVVNCKVETEDGVRPVRVRLDPQIKFKRGLAKKVRLKVKDVEGPSVLRSLIWSTVGLEKSLGIFHGEMVDEINDFLHNKCRKRHGS